MSALTATYVSTTSFTVSTDKTGKFKKGLRVKLSQGVDGEAQVTVVSSSYSSGTGLTTVVVKQSFVRSHLASVSYGYTYADPTNDDSNTGEHYHTGEYDGGLVPSSALTGDMVLDLFGLPDRMVAVEGDMSGLSSAMSDAVHYGGQISKVSSVPKITGVRETGGPTDLTLGAVADGQVLARSGNNIVGQTLSSAAPADISLPAMMYKNSTNIYLPAGRYFKGGYRHRGQYKNINGLGNYWDIAPKLDANVSGTYSQGASSGIVGGKVNNSWYSVFLVGNDANSVMLLPWIYTKKVAYSTPNTVINPKSHYDAMGIVGTQYATTAGNSAGQSWRVNTSAATMVVSGTRARVYLSSPTNGGCVIDHVGIGQRANMGYGCDTAQTPVEVTFNGGQHGVTLVQNGGIIVSDWVDVSIASGQQAVVIIDINAAAGQYLGFSSGVSNEGWKKDATASYNQQNPGGFNSSGGQRFVVAVELGTEADDEAYLTSNDLWNDYRLVKFKVQDPVTDGDIYTIADSVSGAPDQLLITGDQTSAISYGDWFQLIPPASVDCAYLGTIKFDGSGNLLQFNKNRFSYTFSAAITTDANIRSPLPFATPMDYAIPPCAEKVSLRADINSVGTGASALEIDFYDSTGTNILAEIYRNGSNATYTEIMIPLLLDMNLTGKIVNRMQMYTGSWALPTVGSLAVYGFEE